MIKKKIIAGIVSAFTIDFVNSMKIRELLPTARLKLSACQDACDYEDAKMKIGRA